MSTLIAVTIAVQATDCKMSPFVANPFWVPSATVVVNGTRLENGDATTTEVGTRVEWSIDTSSPTVRIASALIAGNERAAENGITLSGSFLAGADATIAVTICADRFCMLPTTGLAAPIYMGAPDLGPCNSIPTPPPVIEDPIVILPPIAEANGPYATLLSEVTTFSSAGSSDPNPLTITFLWDFGDGITSTDENPDHLYASEGNYSARLAVTNSAGKVAYDSAPVSVYVGALHNPIAEANGPYVNQFGSQTTLSSVGSYDPDGGALTYLWDLGDNEISEEANPVHTYAEVRSYQVTLTVTNPLGVTATDTATVDISVPAGPPPEHFGETPSFYSALGIGKKLMIKWKNNGGGWCNTHPIDLLKSNPAEDFNMLGKYYTRQFEIVHAEDVQAIISYMEEEVV